MDKRVVGRKSTTMEKEAFQRSLNDLIHKGLDVKEVVTDAHIGIGYLMRTAYPGLKHSTTYGTWKDFFIQAGQQKGCKDILAWAKHIVNHFWYACREATSYLNFINIWGQARHHVCNEHQWILSEGEGPAECSHGDLDDLSRPEWLTKESPSARAISDIVLDSRLRNNYGYLENFRMTADIEVFNNLILMYCAKRFAYSPPAYRTRNQLAALDNNFHIDRQLKLNKKGEVVYHRTFNKKSGRWSVYPCKLEKEYRYVNDLLKNMLVRRLDDREGMHRPKEMAADDPRRLSSHLAPVSPEPTKQLVDMMKSRKREMK
ncbi:uncharacterized protein [Argopecten irradians]|uniref:uncharacterized protein n=1 Tax=Argopecten irradians TaxID=31199 RepID=UPI003714524E